MKNEGLAPTQEHRKRRISGYRAEILIGALGVIAVIPSTILIAANMSAIIDKSVNHNYSAPDTSVNSVKVENGARLGSEPMPG